MDSDIATENSPLVDLDATEIEYAVPDDKPPRVY